MESYWPKTHGENPSITEDNKLSKEVLAKIKTLRNFLPCGDLISDYNYFLEISGRQVFYKKATPENVNTVLEILKKMLTSWQETQMEETDTNLTSEQKIFFQEIPHYEIEAIDRLINFYENKV